MNFLVSYVFEEVYGLWGCILLIIWHKTHNKLERIVRKSILTVFGHSYKFVIFVSLIQFFLDLQNKQFLNLPLFDYFLVFTQKNLTLPFSPKCIKFIFRKAYDIFQYGGKLYNFLQQVSDTK